jgi:hypothetical protein
MTTTVSNVRVSNICPKYKNLKEWTQDPQNIYIGRKGIVFINNERFPKENSPWANPFKKSKDGLEKSLYWNYIVAKLDGGELDIRELKDKNLGCWCVSCTTSSWSSWECHGQILLYLLEKIE